MPSNHLILCHPLILMPSIFPSIRGFSNAPALHIRWPKYWSFSFSISPSNQYSGFISCKINWFNLLEVQVTLRRLLQHHSSKASILQCSAFFIVQLSHPYMTTAKIIGSIHWGLRNASQISPMGRHRLAREEWGSQLPCPRARSLARREGRASTA